jgi:hypothetical protein
MVAAVVEPERLIFVEECGTHTSLAPIYGLRAQRRAAVSVGTQKPGQEHYSLLSSMTIEGMGPSLSVGKELPPPGYLRPT